MCYISTTAINIIGNEGCRAGGAASENDVGWNKLWRMRQSNVLCEKYGGLFFRYKRPALSIGEIIGACVGPKARLIERNHKELRHIVQIREIMIITTKNKR